MTRLRKILVITQDAGSSEILSSLVRAERRHFDWLVVVSPNSPANRIFRAKGLEDVLKPLPEASGAPAALIEEFQPDVVFHGTGWQNIDVELQFLKEAAARSIPRVSFLDHWVNYRERFGYPRTGWSDNLPDFIAAGDRHSLRIAAEVGLPRLIGIRNYFFDDFVREYVASREAGAGPEAELLILSEPVSAHAAAKTGKHFEHTYSEHDAIRQILNEFPRLRSHYQVERPVIRLHPADEPRKYDSLAREYESLGVRLEDPRQTPLVSSLGRAGLVIGFESMPLFLCYLIKRPFISFIPVPKKRNMPLPQECCVSSADAFTRIDFTQALSTVDELLLRDGFDLPSRMAQIIGPTSPKEPR